MEARVVETALAVLFLGIGVVLLVRARSPVDAPDPDPASARGSGRAPLADPVNPYAVALEEGGGFLPDWRLVRRRERRVAHLAEAFLTASLFGFGVALLADGETAVSMNASWIAIAMVWGLMLVWEEPGLPRMRSIARAVVASRGVPAEVLTDEHFVGLGATPVDVRAGSQAVGFYALDGSALYLHATDGDWRIPRERVTEVRRMKIPEDTLGLIGARCVRLGWVDEGGGAQALCLLGRDGETSFAIKRASAALAKRLEAWARPRG